jgi:hypothetical protein
MPYFFGSYHGCLLAKPFVAPDLTALKTKQALEFISSACRE